MPVFSGAFPGTRCRSGKEEAGRDRFLVSLQRDLVKQPPTAPGGGRCVSHQDAINRTSEVMWARK